MKSPNIGHLGVDVNRIIYARKECKLERKSAVLCAWERRSKSKNAISLSRRSKNANRIN